MSLAIIQWDSDRFAAICSDGLALQHQNGKLAPVGEDHRKFHMLADDLIFVGTGMMDVNKILGHYVAQFAQEHRTDPNLFAQLEEMIPLRLREWFDGLCRIDSGMDSEWLQTNFAAIALVGYDAAQQKIRCVFWNNPPDFESQESGGQGAQILGYPEAVDIAKPWVEQSLSSDSSPDNVLANLEHIVSFVAETCSGFVNKNYSSHLMVHPKIKTNVLN